MLAYHYSKGENLEKTEEYMLKAGEEAKKASASNEMIYYYMNVMNLYIKTQGDRADPARLADFEENIGTALFIRGRFGESCEHLEKALSRFGHDIKLGFANTLTSIVTLARLALRVHLHLNMKKRPDEKDIRIAALAYFTAQAFSVNDFTKSLLAGMIGVRFSLGFDITSSQVCFDMFAVSSLMFSYGGLSTAISRKILNHSLQSLQNKAHAITLHSHMYCLIIHKVCSGEWEDDYNKSGYRTR